MQKHLYKKHKVHNKHKKHFSKKWAFIALAILLLGLAVVIPQLQKQQNTSSEARFSSNSLEGKLMNLPTVPNYGPCTVPGRGIGRCVDKNKYPAERGYEFIPGYCPNKPSNVQCEVVRKGALGSCNGLLSNKNVKSNKKTVAECLYTAGFPSCDQIAKVYLGNSGAKANYVDNYCPLGQEYKCCVISPSCVDKGGVCITVGGTVEKRLYPNGVKAAGKKYIDGYCPGSASIKCLVNISSNSNQPPNQPPHAPGGGNQR